MNDTAEVKLAADKLEEALSKLEGALGPMLSDMKSLRKVATEAEHFEADRTSLAQQLDEAIAKASEAETQRGEAESKAEEARLLAEGAQAREDEFRELENDYRKLASDNIAELDSIIAQVRTALGQGA